MISYGIKSLIAIVLSAVFRLGREALKSCLSQEAVFAISFFVNGVAALFIELFRHPLAAAGACSVSLPVVFSENGSTLFGTGYALFACMKSTVNYRWFSEAQFLDAVAVGQKTPGPFLSTATFVGYPISGLGGAVVSTAGIFPPSFFFVPVLNRALKNENAMITSAFLDAINISSVAVILKVSIELFHSAIFDADTAMIAVTFGLIEIRYRIHALHSH